MVLSNFLKSHKNKKHFFVYLKIYYSTLDDNMFSLKLKEFSLNSSLMGYNLRLTCFSLDDCQIFSRRYGTRRIKLGVINTLLSERGSCTINTTNGLTDIVKRENLHIK